MSSFGKRIDGPDGRRGSARHATFVAGSAVAVEGSHSIVVENISRDGLKLHGRDLPLIGKQILVWMEGLDILGSVVWAKFNERGIVFDEPLEPVALTCLEEHAGL
jgi:hypothetical protein